MRKCDELQKNGIHLLRIFSRFQHRVIDIEYAFMHMSDKLHDLEYEFHKHQTHTHRRIRIRSNFFLRGPQMIMEFVNRREEDKSTLRVFLSALRMWAALAFMCIMIPIVLLNGLKNGMGTTTVTTRG